MLPARTLGDAAYNSLLNYGRNVWDEPSEWWSFDKTYVDRSLLHGQGAAPWQRISSLLLHARDDTKVLLTGPTGTGKSMELRRLTEDPRIQNRFEIVQLSMIDSLNAAIDNDISHVLFTTASRLIHHLVGLRSLGLGRWNRLADWSTRLGFEPTHHQQVATLEPRRLQSLVSTLLVWVEEVFGRKVLLIIDDGDKLRTEASMLSVFVRGLRLLAELPCKMILTHPLPLAFREDFGAPNGIHHERLFNIAVIEHGDPMRLLESARTFFTSLLDRLVDPGAGLIDPIVIDEAIRLSAGVPREIVRLLQKGAEVAAESGSSRVDSLLFANAVASLRRTNMLPQTRLGGIPTALMRARRTETVREATDLTLLRVNLLVEYGNETPWYDVNPLLTGYIDDLIESEHERLSPQPKGA